VPTVWNVWPLSPQAATNYIPLPGETTNAPRDEYQEQLAQLREDVLYMSEIMLERLRLGLDALEQKDEDLAWEVIDGDREVNELYLDLGKKVTER